MSLPDRNPACNFQIIKNLYISAVNIHNEDNNNYKKTALCSAEYTYPDTPLSTSA